VLYQVELRPSVDRSSRKSGTPEAQYRGGLHARQRRRAGPLLRFPQVTPDNRPVEARRPQALEAGLFLLVAALPLALFPLSAAAFVDVKLLVLALGTCLIWVSGLPVDRRLAPPAFALELVFVLGAILGVDRATSLVGEIRPTALVMLACAMTLVAVAPAIPDSLLGRARGWLVWSAVVASLVALTEHLAPTLLDVVAARESFIGGTLGNPVLLAGFLASAIAAALARPDEPSWRTAVIFVALGSGFAVVGERSAFLLPPVALLATWWFVRPDRRRLVLAVGAMGRRHRVVDAGSERDRQPIRSRPGRGAVRDLTAERKRFAMWQAQARAVIDRPILGWVRGTNGAPSCPPGPRSR